MKSPNSLWYLFLPHLTGWYLVAVCRMWKRTVSFLSKMLPVREGGLMILLSYAAGSPAFLCLSGHIPFSWLLQTEGSLLPVLSVRQADAPPFCFSIALWLPGTGHMNRFPPYRLYQETTQETHTPCPGCIRKPPKRSTLPAQCGHRNWELEAWWHSYVNRITELFPLWKDRCGAR